LDETLSSSTEPPDICGFTTGAVGEGYGMTIELPERSQSVGPTPGVEPRVKLRLRPLMHELMDCQLVERFAPGVWMLKGDVQGLLEDEYRGAHESRGNRIFIGLRCELCGVRAITSLVDGRRTCSACTQVSG
jgi:hypothetical protein